MYGLFNKAKAMVKLLKMSKGESFKFVEIPEIPEEWTGFLDSNDEWVSVKLPEAEDATACLYSGKAGTIFPPHKHKNSEQFTILNEGGKIEVITKNGDFILEFPNSYFIKKGDIHAVKFITDTKGIIIWEPSFNDGWKAKFSSDE